MIAGMPLSELGGRVRNQTRALDLAAEALVTGEAVPERAAALIAKIGMPRFFYIWMGNYGWKRQAKKSIDVKSMYSQPYREA